MNENTDEIYEKVMNSGILEQGIKIGMEKGKEIGREEGIEKGIKEGRFNLAIELKNTLGKYIRHWQSHRTKRIHKKRTRKRNINHRIINITYF